MPQLDLQFLKRERAKLREMLDLLDSLIDKYSKIDPELEFKLYKSYESKITESNQFPLFVSHDFPKDKTWLKQLLHLIDEQDRFLGVSEIAELLTVYYPDKNVHELKRKVSVVISAAYKNNKVRGLIKLKVSSLPQGFVWGYKKWLNKDNEILQKHKPIRYEKSLTW